MHTAIFPGRHDSLSAISQFVIQAAQQAGLDRDTTYQVELAVDEACSNIIDHAYQGQEKGEIECTIQVETGKLTITLRDQGEPFSPEQIPQPQLKLPLHKIKRRGVGLYLIRKMVDEFKYETTPGIGNRLTLVKFFTPLTNN
jgi:serine/threonine-protein kinase RsbW